MSQKPARLQELAPLLAELQPQLSGEGQALRAGLLSCIRALAGALDGPQHLLEALGAIASKMPGPSPSSAAVLEAMEAAALALPAVSSEVRCSALPQAQHCLRLLLTGPLERVSDVFQQFKQGVELVQQKIAFMHRI